MRAYVLLDDGVWSGYVWSVLSAEYGSTEMVGNPARPGGMERRIMFPFPRSRLRILSSETGSAVPSCASLLILHAHAKSRSYSRDSSDF